MSFGRDMPSRAWNLYHIANALRLYSNLLYRTAQPYIAFRGIAAKLYFLLTVKYSLSVSFLLYMRLVAYTAI